jgi:hypothetical protein
VAVILATWEAEIRRIMVPGQLWEKVSKPLPEKRTEVKRASGVAQMVVHLTNKHKALSSNPRTAKKNKLPF